MHLGQRFVHALDAHSGLLHVLGALAPAGAHRPNFRRGTKRFPQQSIGVQLQQPLAFLHVALAPRQILGVVRMYQPDLEAGLLPYVVHRNPVHSRGLQHYGFDSALLQEFRHALEFRRKTSEHPHRFAIPVWRHRHVMLATADINYQCRRHRDAPPPNRDGHSKSSAPVLFSACV